VDHRQTNRSLWSALVSTALFRDDVRCVDKERRQAGRTPGSTPGFTACLKFSVSFGAGLAANTDEAAIARVPRQGQQSFAHTAHTTLWRTVADCGAPVRHGSTEVASGQSLE
jgi:hypothetical protein